MKMGENNQYSPKTKMTTNKHKLKKSVSFLVNVSIFQKYLIRKKFM